MSNNRIKQLRLQQNLSQESIAHEAGISQSQMSKYENNQYSPTLSHLRNIARVLNVELLQLVYDTDAELEKAIQRWRQKRR